MVHALEEIRRLLRPGGILIDIHPFSGGSLIKAFEGDRVLFAKPKRDTHSENVLHADEAVAQVVERGLFVIEGSGEFDFLTYGSSIPELHAYLETVEAFDKNPKEEAVLTWEAELYAQVDEIMRSSRAGAEVAIHERARITRLKPMGR
jgi:SAM-dependent methyltransferase